MLIDLHNHTNQHSSCSRISATDLIEQYIRSGIDGICITDHNYLWNDKEKNDLKKKYEDKIKIFFGAEIDADIGHVLVFSYKDHDLYENLKYIPINLLYRKINLETTALIWAHPLRWRNKNSTDFNKNNIKKFDAIELLNGNCDEETILSTKKIFGKHNCKFVGGSDTHSLDMAIKYGTDFENSVKDQRDLVYSIKYGKFKPVKLKKL
ncbi:MAG TPA: PHP domain-containing protein [Spirochaetota bacterium]|nr:PHP domain-containing protein [Spirochaetota bacterium]HOS32580.1 PHP domain-containing protein [Spirochaetota bacterium]HOS54650.1 PHP domain-containing protein [Spirochaetota bacterium]HPK62040.1 PHP domain-containing protein [Spirochaetota bacterium]HQF77330.1 PHP domain-containing protein [Spirochaetota bacterium]